MRSRSYYSFGISLHKVLERFHDAQDAGVETVSEALAALEESWLEAGYDSPQEMDEALNEGRLIIETYVERQVAAKRDAKTLFCEHRLKLGFGEFDLVGQLDRVDELADGTIEVIDYKSGRETVTPSDIQMDLAMSCYQLMMRHQFPGRRVQATIVALRSGAEASYSLTDEEAEVFRQDLVFIGGQILNREWEYVVPTRKRLCEGCEFVPLCRKYEEWGD